MGFYDGAKIVTNGLVLSLDAADRNSYPGSGTTWRDMSQSGNNGTINGATFNSSNGGYFTFNGTNNHVELTLTSNQMNLDNITIGVWTMADAGSNGFLVSTDDISNKVAFMLNCGGNGAPEVLNGLGSYYDGGTGWKNSGLNTQIRGDNKFHYIAGTFRRREELYEPIYSYYIDGVLDKSTQYAGSQLLPKNSSVGRIGRYGTEYYSGKIAAVHIYNRALSDAELLRNYQAQKSRFGL